MRELQSQHISYNFKYAPSKDSEQPAHPDSLFRSFIVRQWIANYPTLLYAANLD